MGNIVQGIGALNNISNLKLGNNQIKNVYLGNNGVWTNEVENDYTITNELTFKENLSEYFELLNGFSSNITVDDVVTSNMIFSDYEPTKIFNGNTIITESFEMNEIIYKQNNNVYNLSGSTFNFTYNNNDASFPLNYLTTPQKVITNGDYNGELTFIDTDLNYQFELLSSTPEKITSLEVMTNYTEVIQTTVKGVAGIYIHCTMSSSVYQGRINLYSQSRFKFNGGTISLWGTDSTGHDYQDYLVGDGFTDLDGVSIYSFDDNKITLDWYYNVSSLFGESPDGLSCEFSITSLGVYIDGTGDTLILVQKDNFGNNLNVSFDGQIKYYYGQFSAYNTAPLNVTLSHYKSTMNYQLIDIYIKKNNK